MIPAIDEKAFAETFGKPGDIKLNKRFSLRRDQFQWILIDTVPSERGKSGISTRKNFYPTLSQVAQEIVSRSGEGCANLQQIINAFKEASDSILCGLMDLEESK